MRVGGYEGGRERVGRIPRVGGGLRGLRSRRSSRRVIRGGSVVGVGGRWRVVAWLRGMGLWL